MKTLLRFNTAALILLLAACVNTSSLDMNALSAAEINNFRAPEADVLSTGQPTAEQLRVMANSGVRHVISLRPEAEDTGFDEEAMVEALGMSFTRIPVSVGDGGINGENAQSLQALLAEFEGEGVVVHCATGNRVGALISVSEFAEGNGLEASISEGARWGMTSERLQGIVRQNLSAN
ncbi:MAG: sulfur transferase domain-containing protein [Gammaproteobacteria bacterium]|nr:sulfur transferase domain-containing protein [Gammaproteobacteria bacterium]MDD9896901.1 sulfur transferase domain-containing protein [Gammaproteobacteria bacterium]MDD9957619.1 sulfur transferase domain-containing protein [Gammaproteobacteria bacterium]